MDEDGDSHAISRHHKSSNRHSRINNRTSNLDEMQQQHTGPYRTRSDSTGTSNRTLSNSSASSCELGIDMLLKEMQMIQADDKQQQLRNSNANLNTTVTNGLTGSSGAMNAATRSTSTSSLQIHRGGVAVSLPTHNTSIFSTSLNSHMQSSKQEAI